VNPIPTGGTQRQSELPLIDAGTVAQRYVERRNVENLPNLILAVTGLLDKRRYELRLTYGSNRRANKAMI
jgi:hypothetical protein